MTRRCAFLLDLPVVTQYGVTIKEGDMPEKKETKKPAAKKTTKKVTKKVVKKTPKAKAASSKSTVKKKTPVKTASKPKAKAKPRAKAQAKSKVAKLSVISASDRHSMIEVAAYYKALERGLAAGGSEGDWFAAEAQVDAQLKASGVVLTA